MGTLSGGEYITGKVSGVGDTFILPLRYGKKVSVSDDTVVVVKVFAYTSGMITTHDVTPINKTAILEFHSIKNLRCFIQY